MKKITAVILSILLCGTVLAGHKHKKRQGPSDNIISVGLHRSACYGRCPVYSIEIKSDGTAIYTALANTLDTGIFTKNIGQANALEIISLFNTYRVDTCKNIYRTRIPDMPGLLMVVKYKDSTKAIRNANFGPSFLRQLSNEMEKVGVKTDSTWQKTSMPNAQ